MFHICMNIFHICIHISICYSYPYEHKMQQHVRHDSNTRKTKVEGLVPQMDESCPKQVWHDSFESCLMYEWVMSHTRTSHVNHICVTWQIQISKVVFDIGWVMSHIRWLMSHTRRTHSYVWHGSLICETRPIHMCDMTHSYVWHDPKYVWHDSFVCATCEFICVTWLIHMRDMWVHMCNMTDSYVRLDTCVWRDDSWSSASRACRRSAPDNKKYSPNQKDYLHAHIRICKHV